MSLYLYAYIFIDTYFYEIYQPYIIRNFDKHFPIQVQLCESVQLFMR